MDTSTVRRLSEKSKLATQAITIMMWSYPLQWILGFLVLFDSGVMANAALMVSGVINLAAIVVFLVGMVTFLQWLGVAYDHALSNGIPMRYSKSQLRWCWFLPWFWFTRAGRGLTEIHQRSTPSDQSDHNVRMWWRFWRLNYAFLLAYMLAMAILGGVLASTGEATPETVDQELQALVPPYLQFAVQSLFAGLNFMTAKFAVKMVKEITQAQKSRPVGNLDDVFG